jgi:hypothetical protein
MLLPVEFQMIHDTTTRALAPTRLPHINYTDVSNLINATPFARHQGEPLNQYIVIPWKNASEFSGETRDWLVRQSQLLISCAAWMRYRRIQIRYVWSREINTSRDPQTNLFVHVPPTYREEFRAFLDKIAGFSCIWDKDRADTPAQQAAVLRRMCGTISPTEHIGGVGLADGLGIKPLLKSLPVFGKRCGCHRSVDRKARREAAWNELTALPALHAALEGVSHV